MVNELDPRKIFVQYRDIMRPFEPILGRKYTITHSDTTADLFLFVGGNYAEDQITPVHGEVMIAWEKNNNGLALIGYVIVDDKSMRVNAAGRNKIFYDEMPTALQALRKGDRFLFDKNQNLDNAPVFIQFFSSNPMFDKTYDFGTIGKYK